MSLRPSRAVVVTLSFVFLVGGAVEWWHLRTARLPRGNNPILSGGELMKYITYKRVCRTDADCERPLSCVSDERVQNRRCLTSECETDLQCESGFVCRVVSDQPIVRICKATGSRKEGERCHPDAARRNESCGPGLLCLRHHCGRFCRLDDPKSCPRGTVCTGSRNGSACVPCCAPGTCPSEKQCIPLEEGLAVCGTVVTINCDLTPCPEGQLCDRSMVGMKDRVAMRCLPSCAPDKPCAAGSYCSDGRCVPTCQKDADCAPLEECAPIPDLRLSLCQFRGE